MLFSKIIVVNGINKFQFFTRYRYQQCMLAQARPPMINHLIIRLTHANVWESMGKPCSCMQFIKSRIFYCKSRENPYQYYKSRENPYQVLQVTRAASERAMKSKVRMIKSLSP